MDWIRGPVGWIWKPVDWIRKPVGWIRKPMDWTQESAGQIQGQAARDRTPLPPSSDRFSPFEEGGADSSVAARPQLPPSLLLSRQE